MSTPLILEGACWKFGHNLPTDTITPTAYVMRGMGEMVKHVLENANPDFPKNVQKGDIIVAGRNFGCSSGRAIAPKAIKATGVGAVIAEFFSRTFYRNGPEIGLPLLEAPGLHDLVETGHRDVERLVPYREIPGRAERDLPGRTAVVESPRLLAGSGNRRHGAGL